MSRHFRRAKDPTSTDGEQQLEELRRLRGVNTPLPPAEKPYKQHRSWPRRLLIGFNILLATLLVAGVASYGYYKWRFGQINKVDLGSILDNSGAGDPMTILMVGSDSRENLAKGEAKSFGSASKVGGQRSDTIMLLHIDPKTKQAAILSLPRDLWVTLSSTNGKGKINSAFDGGEAKLIQTIKQNFNIPIDHYVEVDFDGFKGIVDSIGGVQVPFPAPVRDWGFDDATGTTRNLSGLDIRQAGCVNLTGNQALSYVRSRHYQVFESGRWISDPQSDLTRIQRQQDFIRRVIRKSVSKGSTNPLTLNALIGNGVKNVKIDSGFSGSDMLKIAKRFQPLDPSQVQMMTMPNKAGTVAGASVLLVKQPDAQETIDRFLGKTTDAANSTANNLPPESISVRVLNGSGVSGQASQAANDLSDAGFVRAGVGDGRSTANTTIRYAPGTIAKAQTLATYVQGPTTLVQDPTIKGVDVIMVLGQSFQGISAPGAAKPTTTTTAPAPSSTTTTTASPFVPSSDSSC